MVDALTAIHGVVQGKTLPEFSADPTAQAAVERWFEIVGEAAKHLPESLQRQRPGVQWRAMIRMRDFLSHSYFRADAEELWQTATVDVPVALRERTSLLDEIDEPE